MRVSIATFMAVLSLKLSVAAAADGSFLDIVCADDVEIGIFAMTQDAGKIGSFTGVGIRYWVPVTDALSFDVRMAFLEDEFNVLLFGTGLIPLESNIDWRFSFEQLTPYIGAGIGYYIFSDIDSTPGFNAHGGFKYELVDGITLFGELRYLAL